MEFVVGIGLCNSQLTRICRHPNSTPFHSSSWEPSRTCNKALVQCEPCSEHLAVAIRESKRWLRGAMPCGGRWILASPECAAFDSLFSIHLIQKRIVQGMSSVRPEQLWRGFMSTLNSGNVFEKWKEVMRVNGESVSIGAREEKTFIFIRQRSFLSTGYNTYDFQQRKKKSKQALSSFIY